MFKKLTLAAAAGAGYVLGAKAGKERYRQIEAKFREIAGMPAVQNATASVKETASGVADTAKATVSEKASAVTDKAKEVKGSSTGKGDQDVVVDLGTGANTGATAPITTPTTPATPPRTTPPTTGTGTRHGHDHGRRLRQRLCAGRHTPVATAPTPHGYGTAVPSLNRREELPWAPSRTTSRSTLPPTSATPGGAA